MFTPRSSGSLRNVLLAILAVVVLLAAGVPALMSAWLGREAVRQGAESRLAASLAGFRMQQPDRLAKLELMARVLATDPVLAGYLVEIADDEESVKLLDLLEGYQDRLAFHVAAVFDTASVMRATVGAPITDVASLEPTLTTARETDRARGIWRDGANLRQAAALPIVRDFELVGHVVVAFSVDDGLARQLAALGGEDVVFAVSGTTGGAVPIAGTAAPARAAALVDALAQRGDALTEALRRGETVSSIVLDVEGGSLLAGIEPLRDASGQAVAAVIATSSPSSIAPGLRRVPLLAALVGLVALALGGTLVPLMVARSQKPWQRVAEAAEGISQGEAGASLPELPGDAGRTIGALARLASDRSQQQSLSHAVLMAAATPSGARTAGETGMRAEARTSTVLVAELRRFADPRLGYDPEANLERFTADLRRLRASIRDRQGRIVSVAGHRVLAVFEGEDAAFRALAAASEAARALAVGESVFDQPEPPVIALAAGGLVHGQVAWGTGAGPALLGLPMQQIESLVREGTPGEICLPKNVFSELASAFAEAGEELQPQRGVMSPQELYSVPSEVAAKVTGISLAPPMEREQGRRELADVAIGTTLAGRFEVQAELLADGDVVRFEVRDRERGLRAMLALLRPHLLASPDELERLASAFRKLRTLDHPHIVPVWDFGEAEGLPYVLMPFVPGERLRTMLAAGPLSAPATLGVARQVAAGLSAAHHAGVLHGDLRPDHILVQGSGLVRVGGFAVGASAQSAAAASYRSPESVGGAVGGAAAEIYAFGATLYETLAGRPPVVGATPAEIQKRQMAEEPPPLAELAGDAPAELVALVMQCLDRDPGSRPASFDAVVEQLDVLRV